MVIESEKRAFLYRERKAETGYQKENINTAITDGFEIPFDKAE